MLGEFLPRGLSSCGKESTIQGDCRILTGNAADLRLSCILHIHPVVNSYNAALQLFANTLLNVTER